MRKRLQRQILELLTTMGEGLCHAGTAREEELFTGLNDAYIGAEVVWESIKAALTPQRASFYKQLLQALQAQLVATNNRLNEGDSFAAEITAARETLAGVRHALEEESEARWLVAFFPYNASMWDSLESIWQAAVKDPQCDVVVVPIPYYDKNPDGSFARQHDESVLFPADVPVVNWREYDVATEKPDIAYIHNPYDQHNTVSSVDPAFFSHTLKQYVDMLVYVPYYVNRTPSSAGFVSIAAACAADVLVAATEADAKAFQSAAPQKIVLKAGSPKIDRMLWQDAHKPPLPQEWEHALAGKTIFFFNTSVQSMLQYEEQYLSKLRDTFALFAKTEHIALLWRPHPLLGAAVASMRPAFQAQYNALLADFATGDYGVLDESWDAGRALALADAYIGDETSSMAFLFAVTGKPIYFFSFGVTGGTDQLLQEEESLRAEAFSASIRQGRGQGFSTTRNAFCRFDLFSGKTEELFTVTQEEAWKPHLYGGAVAVEAHLWLAPILAKGFLRVDIDNYTYQYIPVPPTHDIESPLFSGGFIHRGKVWFIGQMSGIWACCDEKTGEISYHDDWLKDLALPDKPPGIPYFSGAGAVLDDIIYMPLHYAPFIVAFHPLLGTAQLHKVGTGHCAFIGMLRFDDAFWLWQWRGSAERNQPEMLIRWDEKTGKTTNYSNFPPGFCVNSENPSRDTSAFSSLMPMPQDSSVVAFPRWANMAVKLNVNTGQMEPYPLDVDFDITARKNESFAYDAHLSYTGRDADTLYFLAGYDRRYLVIDAASGRLRHSVAFLAPKALFRNPQRYYTKGAYRQEILYPLSRFVQDVLTNGVPAYSPQQAESQRSGIYHADGTSGQAIHQAVMDRMPKMV